MILVPPRVRFGACAGWGRFWNTTELLPSCGKRRGSSCSVDFTIETAKYPCFATDSTLIGMEKAEAPNGGHPDLLRNPEAPFPVTSPVRGDAARRLPLTSQVENGVKSRIKQTKN